MKFLVFFHDLPHVDQVQALGGGQMINLPLKLSNCINCKSILSDIIVVVVFRFKKKQYITPF